MITPFGIQRLAPLGLLAAVLLLGACTSGDTTYSGAAANNDANNDVNNVGNNDQNNDANNDINNDVNNDGNNDTNNDVNNDPPPGLEDGAACTADDQCAGGTCLPEDDGFPGGYCTTSDCAGGQACNGGQCAFLDNSMNESACFGTCQQGPDCREGYQCRRFGDVGLCLPLEEEPTGDRADGDPCTDGDQCAGGVCLTEDDGFPEGSCTTINCRNRDDCTGENRACLQAGNPNYCIQLCEEPSDCREGYICQPVQGGAYCAPSPTAGTNVPEEGDLPFDLVCGETLVQPNAFQGGLDRHRMTFDIPEGATSFMVVPYSPGNQIYPVSLEGPGGDLNFFGDYNFALANAGFLINLTPILVPQAPQFAQIAQPGSYTLDMAAESNLCRYVVSKNGPGTTVDLNLHFVGVNGINAGNAPQNQNFQQALAQFDEIYEQLGVDIGQIRYIDVTGNAAAQFRVVRSQEAAFQLVATSEAPGETSDEALSINVFFIQQFAIQGGSVLGISAGLPGAAGLHGTRGSGLVFAASVFGDPELLGQVLAHEVGHYLGLFHTTEQGGRGFDPLGDTPQCASNQWNNPNGCPDIDNLMFPFAGNSHTQISGNQSTVLQANPLIK